MPLKKNLSRGSLSNWCDADAEANADADTDISKTICRPPPYAGVQHNEVLVLVIVISDVRTFPIGQTSKTTSISSLKLKLLNCYSIL